MIIVRNPQDLNEFIRAWKNEGFKVGFVPTMGALHKGHISLMKIARKNADKCVVSIFVNPTQFAPHEDFDKYPRDEKRDLDMLRAANVDLVYLPGMKDIYPNAPMVDVKAGAPAQGLESDIRPHFFDGVVSVVSRLFAQVEPDIAVFGEKDYQQLQVIMEMVVAKDLPIKIIPGPIARDEFGLALSSRNAYLSLDELKIARKLNVILSEAANALAAKSKDLIQSGSDPSAALRSARDDILAAGFDEVQYLETRWGRLLAAVKLGKLRLIDNTPVQ